MHDALNGLNEMAEAIEALADNAAQVESEVAHTAQSAQEGDEIVQRSVAGMQEVSAVVEHSAQQIRDAEEVRKLAGRSDASAREIAVLIADIQNRAANAVQDMETGAGKVNEQVEEIRRAGRMLQAMLTTA